MLKTKNLVILAVIVVILAGISFIQKSGHEKTTSAAATAVVAEGDFSRENLQRITIGYGDQPEIVVLAAQPDGWVVESAWDAPADEQKIDNLLRNLSNLSGEFRSDKADVLADYGLDDAASIKIRGTDAAGTEVLAVDVGKKAEGGQGNFICRPGSSDVYLSSKGVLNQLGVYGEVAAPKQTHFIALQAVKEDRQDIERIVLRDGDQTLDLIKKFSVIEPAPDDTTGAEPTIDRSTWEWRLAGRDDVVLAKSKVDGVLGALVNLRATDVDDPGVGAAAYGLDQPTRSATLVRQDGSQRELRFGGQREAGEGVTAGVWLQVDGKAPIWVVADYTTRNVFKSLDDLKAD